MNLLPPAGHLPALLDQSPDGLRAWFADRGQPALRVKQVRRWLLAGRAESFEQMSDLPRDVRAELGRHFAPLGNRVERHLVATDETHKLLLRLPDDADIGADFEQGLLHTAPVAGAIIKQGDHTG